MKFNINEHVSVRLTEEGRKVYRGYLEGFNFPGNPAVEDPEVDSEGYSRFQLWWLMAIFGEHVYNGGPNMFDTDILIHTKEE